MSVTGFDHVALPASDPEAMIRFYGALGFGVPDVETFRAENPLYFHIQLGDQKINVHTPRLWRNERFRLRGPAARPGCADLCFVWSGTVASLQEALARAGVAAIEGPVERAGGRGAGKAVGTSIYCRDPDENLLEFIVYPDPPPERTADPVSQPR